MAGWAIPSPTVTASIAAAANDITNVTDPSIVKQGNTYYLYSSGRGIDIRASHDLVHWHRLGQVFAGVPSWARARIPGATGIWAPDVSFFGGMYHLYYAVSTFGSQHSVIGHATNLTLNPADPRYHWVDHGPVIESHPRRDNFNAIDPNAVVAGGTVWLAFGSQWSGIKLLPLDAATGLPVAARFGRRPVAPRPIGIAARPRSAPLEAAFVLQHGGMSYLFLSFDHCCMGLSSTYNIVVGRSASVGGPYVDRAGKPLLAGGGTLVLSGSSRWRGPGSNAVLSDRGIDWLVYQAYDALNNAVPTLQIRPLFWTSDGWPVAGQALF